MIGSKEWVEAMGTPWTYLPFEGARLVYRDRSGRVSNHPDAVARAMAEVNSGWEGETSQEYQTWMFAHHPDSFRLESGRQLGPISVAYETYGTLSPSADNAILVCHALTGDSHVARHPVPGSREGWWETLVGPGKPLDTNRYYVICSNVLGGCQGTTGPTSIDPQTGRPYGMSFPVITIRDIIRVQKALLDHLGVRRLALVIGGSMGGMQVLEWAVTFPDFVRRAVCLAAPGKVRTQAIAFNEVQRQAIMRDPKWMGGEYPLGEGPKDGLGIARMLGMITYQSEESMERKFGQAWVGDETDGIFSFSGHFQVESYLHYQGKKLVNRFDANSYLYLLKALDLFDLGRGYGGYEAAVARIKAELLVVGVTSDILYPCHQQRELVEDVCKQGGLAHYTEIESPWGHDAFLIEFEKLDPIISAFLGDTFPADSQTATRRLRQAPAAESPAPVHPLNGRVKSGGNGLGNSRVSGPYVAAACLPQGFGLV